MGRIPTNLSLDRKALRVKSSTQERPLRRRSYAARKTLERCFKPRHPCEPTPFWAREAGENFNIRVKRLAHEKRNRCKINGSFLFVQVIQNNMPFPPGGVQVNYALVSAAAEVQG